jgi:hypothetical protein
MNRFITLRPLASVAVLAVATMGVAPAFAARPHASSSSLSRMSQPALAMPSLFQGTVVGLHRAQRIAEISLANGTFLPARFASLAQAQRVHVGSHLIVSGVARNQVRLLVRSVRIQGTSTRAHIRGTVARRLGRAAVELLGMHGAAVALNLGHARITRVLPRGGRFVRTLASIAPGEQLDTAVTLTGAGAVATGTATVVAPPSRPSPAGPSPMQIEVEGNVTAVNVAAGTITIQDEDGPTTVVAVSAAGTYHVGEDVDVVGTATGPGGSAATVQAQVVTREGAEAPASGPATATTGRPAAIKVKGLITAVNAAAGTITIRDEDGPTIVVALGTAAGTYQVGQEVEVVGVPTGAGGSAATVRAQYVTLKDAAAPTAATPLGAHVEVKGLITAANPAAGTLTIQDEDGPTTVVAVSTAAGTYRVGQEVEVSGIVIRARSNGATVQAQFIRLKSSGDDG